MATKKVTPKQATPAKKAAKSVDKGAKNPIKKDAVAAVKKTADKKEKQAAAKMPLKKTTSKTAKKKAESAKPAKKALKKETKSTKKGEEKPAAVVEIKNEAPAEATKPAVVKQAPTPKAKVPDNRLRYSDPELAEFKELIMGKLESSRNELKYYQEQIKRSGDNSTDDTENRFNSEDGIGAMERETYMQMASRLYTFVDHMEKALIRIENKTYGICRVTGKLIDKDRLRAVPHATLSLEAKLTQKKETPHTFTPAAMPAVEHSSEEPERPAEE